MNTLTIDGTEHEINDEVANLILLISNERDGLKNNLKSKTESGAKVPCNDVLSRMTHTKDGKIILWGDKVYFPDPDKMTMDRDLDIIDGVVEAITIGVQFKEYEGTHTVMFGDHESGNLELYSSRELVPLEPGFEKE